jgi:subtilisin-like proprotein convertase family protein
VELAAPSGATATLHDRAGGERDNLQLTLDSRDGGALAALAGGTIAGDWKLRVADLAGHDVGKLNEWWLEVERA